MAFNLQGRQELWDRKRLMGWEFDIWARKPVNNSHSTVESQYKIYF